MDEEVLYVRADAIPILFRTDATAEVDVRRRLSGEGKMSEEDEKAKAKEEAFGVAIEHLEWLAGQTNYFKTAWSHKRSGLMYTVIGLGLEEATLNPVVLYKRLDPALPYFDRVDVKNPIWTRPVAEFLEKFEQVVKVAQ